MAIFGFASPLLGDLVYAAYAVLVTPFMYIGATLVYLDLRVRNEDYSLGLLASEVES